LHWSYRTVSATRWKDVHHAQSLSREFRRDVVAVARKGEAPIAQIAKDFGVSPAALHRLAENRRQRRRRESRAPLPLVRKAAGGQQTHPALEQEAEIMRRTVAYLSRDINPKR
jgi:transposase